MGNFEKLKQVSSNFNRENKNSFVEEEDKQVIEGLVQDINDIAASLPKGIIPEMVDTFLGSDGKWHWHLKPEYIKDEKKREEYKEERDKWP